MPTTAFTAIPSLYMILFGKYQQAGLVVYVVKIIGRLHTQPYIVNCVIKK